MPKTANELLQGILTTVSSIDNNMKRDQKKSGGAPKAVSGVKDALNISGALLKFSLVKPKTTERFITFMKDVLKVSKDSAGGKGFKIFSEGIIGISAALPDLIKSLSELSRMRSSRVDRALGTLSKLYMLMDEFGDGRKAIKINRAIRMFDKLGKALRKITAPLRILSNFLTYLGLSFVVFAVSIIAASKIMGLTTKTSGEKGGGGLVLPIVGVVLGTVAVLVGALVLLTLANKFLKPGLKAIKGIGKGLLFLSLGILGFTLSLLLIASTMQAGLGFGGIMKSLAVLAGVIVGIVGLFVLLGFAGKFVKKGVMVSLAIGFGLAVIALSVGLFVAAAAGISSLMGAGGEKGKVMFLGREVPPYVRGLGAIGMIFLGAAGLFAILGIPAVALLVGTGVAVSMGISLSLILLARSVKDLMGVAGSIPKDFSKQLSAMIGGLLEGIIGGISTLTGGKTGFKGLVEFAKNSAKLFAALGLLASASLTLSMFAKGLTAFAQLNNMREIIGHKENGEPIFGESIDVTKVGQNISSTISGFLIALISSTDGLSREQAGAIKKMGRALTGRRGILSAVIQFADALKVYAEFGENNEIGYIDYDDDGNEIRKKIGANFVVDNMINSFLYFTNRLFSRSEEEFGDGEEAGISGKQKRRMKKMSKALIGRHGILGAVTSFAETLRMFSEFGADNQIPILDAEGKPTGEFLSVGQIADNIVSTLTNFSDTLATKLEKGKAKDAGKALEKYDKMIDKLSKLSKSLDGLTRMSASITELATSIGLLGTNLESLNVDKLGDLSTVSAAYLEKTNSFTNSNQRIMDKSTGAATRPAHSEVGGGNVSQSSSASYSSTASGSKETPVDWDEISQMIGEQVGARVTGALKNGMFKFEFDTTKAGGIYYWSPS